MQEHVSRRHALGALALAPVVLGAGNLTHLQVSMAASTCLYAPYFNAIEKGYYADEGLVLDVHMASGGVATPALLSGTLDISTSNPTALSPALRGAPFKILYTLANRSPFQLWSTKPEFKTLKDLKDQHIGCETRGDSSEIVTKVALLHAGLPLDYVQFTPLGTGGKVAAALAGSLPALVLSQSEAETVRAAGGLTHANLIFNFQRDLPMPYSGIVVTDHYLQTHVQQLRGFLRATMKGVRYMRKFRSQTMAWVEKYSHQTPAVTAIDYDSSVPTLTRDGSVPDDVLKADLIVRASLIDIPADKIPPLDTFYDYRIVHAVNAELDARHWVPTA